MLLYWLFVLFCSICLLLGLACRVSAWTLFFPLLSPNDRQRQFVYMCVGIFIFDCRVMSEGDNGRRSHQVVLAMLRWRSLKAGTADCDDGNEETHLEQHQAGVVVEGGNDVGVDLAIVLIPDLFGLHDGVFRMVVRFL